MKRLLIAYTGFIAAFLAFSAAVVLILSLAFPCYGGEHQFTYFKKKAAAGGGGSSAAVFVQGNVNDGGASASSLGVSLTGVAAGNLIVVFTAWETTTATPTASDGTTSMTAGTINSAGDADRWAMFFYLLSANSGDKTYTITYGATVDWPSVMVMEFNADGGTWSLVAQRADGAGTPAANFSSGNIDGSAIGTSGVAIGGYHTGGSSASSAETVNGASATTNIQRSSLDSMFYVVNNGDATTAAAGTCTSQYWQCNIIAFEAQ